MRDNDSLREFTGLQLMGGGGSVTLSGLFDELGAGLVVSGISHILPRLEGLDDEHLITISIADAKKYLEDNYLRESYSLILNSILKSKATCWKDLWGNQADKVTSSLTLFYYIAKNSKTDISTDACRIMELILEIKAKYKFQECEETQGLLLSADMNIKIPIITSIESPDNVEAPQSRSIPKAKVAIDRVFPLLRGVHGYAIKSSQFPEYSYKQSKSFFSDVKKRSEFLDNVRTLEEKIDNHSLDEVFLDESLKCKLVSSLTLFKYISNGCADDAVKGGNTSVGAKSGEYFYAISELLDRVIQGIGCGECAETKELISSHSHIKRLPCLRWCVARVGVVNNELIESGAKVSHNDRCNNIVEKAGQESEEDSWEYKVDDDEISPVAESKRIHTLFNLLPLGDVVKIDEYVIKAQKLKLYITDCDGVEIAPSELPSDIIEILIDKLGKTQGASR